MTKRQEVFLERSNYRKRRVMDAVCLLPFLGLIFVMLPMLWPSVESAPEAPVKTSNVIIYIFGIWFFLILCAGGLSWYLSRYNKAMEKE